MLHEKFPIEGRATHSLSPPEDTERSGPKRVRLALLCEVRQGMRPWKLARLVDLSTTGFRVAWLPEYDQETALKIRIPGIEMLSARVCWHKGRQIGCEFAAPLHVAVFEHIARLAGGEPAR